jgi:hypothetical protein
VPVGHAPLSHPMTIHANQWPDEDCWVAECDIDGVPYTAWSRNSAPHELARVLVKAGLPDAPMVVDSKGFPGEIRYRSFHKMAKSRPPVGRWRSAPGAGIQRLLGPFWRG